LQQYQTTMAVFLTKKQKKQMRERRRKKKLAEKLEKGEITPEELEEQISKKRPRPKETTRSDTTAETTTSSEHKNVVIIPKTLSTKELKKFRKDARRKARAEGRDEHKLEFVEEAAEREEEPPRKKKKTFPRINELVKQQKMEQEKEKQQQALKQADDSLPEDYKARYLALDCEMVGIGTEGRQSALARVSLVEWHGNTLLDTFVKVPGRVSDFRTWVSGVKPKHIKSDQAMEVSKCRETVASLLKDKVLVGHALKNDLNALMLTHPKQDIRDTAKYRPFQRWGGNKWRARRLRDLVKENLGLIIQEEGQSHDSVDDAKATMELFKLVREAWENDLEAKASKWKK